MNKEDNSAHSYTEGSEEPKERIPYPQSILESYKKKLEPKEEESQEELWDEVSWIMRNGSKTRKQAINESKQHFRISRISPPKD